MNTNFNRSRSQLRCENILGSKTLEEWNQADFRNLLLSQSQATLLASDLLEDAKDLYFKGLLSLFDGFRSINNGLYSWATIKIYYSIFYFLKCTMAANGTGLIRQKKLYYLHALEGKGPISKTNRKYNTDHSGTINYYIDLFGADLLLSQQIDSTNSYDWLMHRREQVNYRERAFNEPHHSDFWNHIASNIADIEPLIKDYVSDNYILCFQEEHAILALPIKRALLTKEKLDAESIAISFTNEQKQVLTNTLPFNLSELTNLYQ